MSEWVVSNKCADLHRRALVWDSHAGFEFDHRNDLNDVYRWRDAGVDYLSFNAGYDVKPWELTISALSGYRAFVESDPERLMLVRTTADIEQARTEGKLAIGFDIEGMRALNEDVSMVALYYELGVRQMLIAYNLNNAAGGGCHDMDIGLTPFGRSVIEEMNQNIGFLAPEAFPRITSALLDNGFSETETLGILGGNFFRLAEHVWR